MNVSTPTGIATYRPIIMSTMPTVVALHGPAPKTKLKAIATAPPTVAKIPTLVNVTVQFCQN